MCKILFVPSKTGVCFFQSSESPVIKARWPSRSDSLGIPSLTVRSQGWEYWHGVQNLHNSGRTSLVLLFSSLWVTHLEGMVCDFIVIVPLLLSCCGFFFDFGCGVSYFSRFQPPPVDGCSTTSCDFGTLTGGDVHMSFTLPSWPRSPLQYTCVENPKARGAWWATVRKVVSSQTQLKWLSTHAAPNKWSLFNIPSSSLSPWTSQIYFLSL